MAVSRALAAAFAALALASGCVSTIPPRELPTWPAAPTGLPALQPCALVHLVVDEQLGDAAHGHDGPWPSTYSTFVLRTARGVVLIDAGLGAGTVREVAAAPFWFRWLLGNKALTAKPLGQLLGELGIAPEQVTDVLLTHTHWDHAGGLRDLPKAKVWIADADASWLRQQRGDLVAGTMPVQFEGLGDRLAPFGFDGPPLLGLRASRDVFGDGSVIALPTPGHTAGATSYLVRSGDGKQWLFVGDAAWVRENYQAPVPRGRLTGAVIDHDRDTAALTLGQLHAIHRTGKAPLVTAHDQRTWVDVPRCVSAAQAP